MKKMNNANDILAAARHHYSEIICPQVDKWEASSEYPLAAAREAARGGLLGLYCPGEYGGQALSFEDAIPVFEELGKGEGLYAFSLSMHNIVSFAICSYGGEELRAGWAARLISGESLGGFVLTEAQSGSDAAKVYTRAIINEDGSVKKAVGVQGSSRRNDGVYELRLVDFDNVVIEYNLNDYTTLVTPITQSGCPRPTVAGTNSFEGLLLVEMDDTSGNNKECKFHFMTFKP